MTTERPRRGGAPRTDAVDRDPIAREQVERDLIALVMDHDLFRTVGFVAWSTLAAFVAWPSAEWWPVLAAWWVVSVAFPVVLIRVSAAHRRDPDARRPRDWERTWARITWLFSAWSGIWWIAFAPYDDPSRAVLVVILAVVLTCCASATLAGSLLGYAAYVVPNGAIMLTCMVAVGHEWFLMGILGLPLTVGLLAFQLHQHRSTVELVKARLRHRLVADRQDLIFETLADAMAVTIDGVVADGNQRFADLLRGGWSELGGRRLLELLDVERTALISPDGSTLPAPDGDPALVVLRRQDGTTVTVEVKGGTLAGHPGHQVWVFADVTARLANERALRRLAEHDHLTGVLNRRALASRLEDIGTEAEGTTGILIIDLDGFKAVNDQYGHQVGDRMLEAVADRIAGVVRGTALVGRLGGDEFMVLAHDLRSPVDLERIATRVCEACRQPVQVGRRTLSISASVGLSVTQGRGSADGAVAEADENMYLAKRSGGDRWVGARSPSARPRPAERPAPVERP